MILLLESKRDDLLLPYFELVKNKIPGLTLGKFKGLMLDKLAAQGNINNLSLGSNFYLAGATKYYFQGELTFNGCALLTGDVKAADNWNSEACRKLNAVINILRNSYIDSVGTKFEVEEDFGNLSIAKLFRKYGKKISAEMGNTSATDGEENVSDGIDRTNSVGNGYTFDILYNYNDATKYNEATSPGAWCITYGIQHYNYYRQALNCHYVIFLKNGYEKIKRKTGPGFTKEKPHDEYGNSMIAFLQKNDSWRPSYITSRWNHGYGDTSGTEADHAYTLEEFCQITGVTPKDLERIYGIWKADKKKYSNDDNDGQTFDKEEYKKASVAAIRRIKYAQMVINNGTGIEEAMQQAGAVLYKTLWPSADTNVPKKSVSIYEISEGDIHFQFICDRGKIVFDSFSPFDSVNIDTLNNMCVIDSGNDVIVIQYENYNRLYSIRYHSMIDIGGQTKFKRLPERARANGVKFIEIKNSMKDICLFSTISSKPLKLPNGQYWFNYIKYEVGNRWHRGGQIFCEAVNDNFGSVAEIIYDESSGEKYIYSFVKNKFIDLQNITNDERVSSYSYRAIQDPAKYPMIIDNSLSNIKNYFAICFTPDNAYNNTTKKRILDLNGRQISIYGETKFGDLQSSFNRYIAINDTKYNYSDDDGWRIYDTVTKKYLCIGNNIIHPREGLARWRNSSFERRFLFLEGGRRLFSASYYNYLIYDGKVGKFVKNPVDGGFVFKVNDTGESNGEGIEIFKDDFDKYDYMQELESSGITDWNERYNRTNAEERKHLFVLDINNLDYFENSYPVNNEYETEQAQQPAFEINESNVKDIVTYVIKKIIK